MRTNKVASVMVGLALAATMLPAPALASQEGPLSCMSLTAARSPLFDAAPAASPPQTSVAGGQAANTVSSQGARVVDSGTWGTCAWKLTSANILTVYPGTATMPLATIAGQDEDQKYVSSVRGVPWEAHRDVKKVIFKEQSGKKVVLPANCCGLLAGLAGLTAADFSGADLSKVRNMSYLFDGCTSLASFSFSKFTSARPTSVSHLFNGCDKLARVYARGLDTSKVTDMSYLFEGCVRLTSANVSLWSTARASNMTGVFMACSSLKKADVSTWKTASATSMRSMFDGCESLASADVSKWNTARVADMSYLFYGCKSLKTAQVGSWNTARAVHMTSLFEGCSALRNPPVANWNTARVETMQGMFFNCSSISSLDLSKWKSARAGNMWGMFNGCASLKSLNLSTLDTVLAVKSGSTGYMFARCDKLSKVVLGTKFRFGDSTTYLPSTKVSGHDTWYSGKARKRFTAKQVASERSGIADTYTK